MQQCFTNEVLRLQDIGLLQNVENGRLKKINAALERNPPRQSELMSVPQALTHQNYFM